MKINNNTPDNINPENMSKEALLIYFNKDSKMRLIGDNPDLMINEMIPFKQIFDEFWVKQTSRAVRSTFKAKAQRGEWVGTKPPYGYMKDPAAPAKHLVPNPETAPVVKKIYDWFTQGDGIADIKAKLKEEKIYTPDYYYYLKTGKQITAVDHEHLNPPFSHKSQTTLLRQNIPLHNNGHVKPAFDIAIIYIAL